MLHEPQLLEHADRAYPVLGRHHQISVNVGTHLTRIQPLCEYRTLEHKGPDPLTVECACDLSRERINRKVTRQLGITLETFPVHRRSARSPTTSNSEEELRRRRLFKK